MWLLIAELLVLESFVLEALHRGLVTDLKHPIRQFLFSVLPGFFFLCI